MSDKRKKVWLSWPGRRSLGEGEVHVWRVRLEQPASLVERLSANLSRDERERARRYYFSRDSRHFTVARGALREIVSFYVDTPAERLRFVCNEYGKPSLPDSHTETLRFNVAHSHDFALYALTRNREIGIDVEFMREELASVQIAESFFSPLEVAMLRALPSRLQAKAFFNCWTRKEAYVKARGAGLSHPLNRFAVSLVPGANPAILRTDDDPAEASRWSLIELSPGPNYVGALAVEGPLRSTSHWRLFN